MNGLKVSGIIPRLNFKGSNKNWLSLKPLGASNYKNGRTDFGELNSLNKPHGRSISIFSAGFISIGYWNDGVPVPGNYLWIYKNGDFRVGEIYLKDAKR